MCGGFARGIGTTTGVVDPEPPVEPVVVVEPFPVEPVVPVEPPVPVEPGEPLLITCATPPRTAVSLPLNGLPATWL